MREDFKGINEDTSDLPHLLKVRQFIDYIYLSTHIYVKKQPAQDRLLCISLIESI